MDKITNFKWHSIFRNSQNKVSAMEVGFLLWMLVVCTSYATMAITSRTLPEIPASVVHLTLALGATKVTHRIAEGNWEKTIEKVIDAVKKKV